MNTAPLSSPEAVVIDGKAAAAAIVNDVREAVEREGIVPGLAVVLVGADPASMVYVRNKGNRAKACGFLSRQIDLAADASESELLRVVGELNADLAIHGILVQFPLPRHIDPQRVIEAIDPVKDVDGFHYENVGRVAVGATGTALVPCTPLGVMRLIGQASGGKLAGKHAVVIGRSNIVGKPLANLLLQESCTVTVVHSRTVDSEALCRQADILIAAVGVPNLVKASWVKPGAVVIDVGINRLVDAKGNASLVGDVAFVEVSAVASAITPVPGGVGPMTIAMLMQNTLDAARRAQRHDR
ncbi:methylenetetrahydrofolate dehydrogenase (NADP+)/methenyltetrahydrofolate cyclohydrolase [Paraburkholderia caballeronis]|uniref:bifunctional 5,10-methylenetetrahydrofolate dehydrogenase/5,10-methenyltetrahydrofolate cyclohydrolase n=1 Tax=Paraburkholderia caballeronis TaxID=416943 RepID=UPI001064B5E7|nr:bifunctional methylenetetrahydrofolate dehydrogenase/methenyltetrahydrofolate cyclohydrolase FolD [Paraburkholderia caballeronis]TDV33826.1 methylenetetrahydrofolate dehydrogenase (NADP+)/methenyltetrahydrofolate cyclohydrolase [Paraburkholderia caballeronis]